MPCYNTHKGSEDCKKVEKKVDAEEEKAREDAQRYFTDDMIQPEKLGQLGGYFFLLLALIHHV